MIILITKKDGDTFIKSVSSCCFEMSKNIFGEKRIHFIRTSIDTQKTQLISILGTEIKYCNYCGTEIKIEREDNETK